MSTKKPIKKTKVAFRYRGTDGVWREIMDVGPFVAPPAYEWSMCIAERDGVRISTFIMN